MAKPPIEYRPKGRIPTPMEHFHETANAAYEELLRRKALKAAQMRRYRARNKAK